MSEKRTGAPGRWTRAVSLALLAAPLAATPAVTQDGEPPGPYPIPRIEGTITLDGRVDEEAWRAVEPLPATMQTPTFGDPPSERTEFRVAYDDEHLYFSCVNHDSDPDGIRATSLRRDDGAFTNDWCIVVLDTFNDGENTVMFGTNPAGIRTDVAAQDDARDMGGSLVFSWNTFWDAATYRDDAGWQAEIRIPLSSLRFQSEDEDVRMGLTAWRYISRKNETITFPAIEPRWGYVSPVKASQTRQVLLRDVTGKRPVYVTPYVLGGLTRSHALNDAETAWDSHRTTAREAGLDVKYGLTSNLTLDLTANTDFAQVEADDQQVNLTRFSLFFPERRLFFQERASIFEFSLGGQERLFHSRRIGLVGGEQVRIYGGARLVGRAGPWDVGFLNMQTAESEAAPSQNFGVLRLRRRVFNESSYLGGIVTTRYDGGGHNVVYGLDGSVRVAGQDYLTFNWSQSFDDGDASGLDPFDRGLVRVRWNRRGLDGLVYGLDLARIGGAFRPEMGFLRRTDVTRIEPRLGYGWRPGRESRVLRWELGAEASAFRRNPDGSLQTLEVTPQWRLQLKSGHTFRLQATSTYDDVRTAFSLPEGTEVPADTYRFTAATAAFTQSTSDARAVNLSVTAGQFYDGRRVSGSVRPTWKVSRHLELGGSYAVDRVTFPDRDQAFTAQIARARIRVMLSHALSGAAFIQYSSAADAVITNLRLRYNPREGTDLYLVYDESLNADRHAVAPTAPLSDRRTFIVKYSRMVNLSF